MLKRGMAERVYEQILIARPLNIPWPYFHGILGSGTDIDSENGVPGIHLLTREKESRLQVTSHRTLIWLNDEICNDLLWLPEEWDDVHPHDKRRVTSVLDNSDFKIVHSVNVDLDKNEHEYCKVVKANHHRLITNIVEATAGVGSRDGALCLVAIKDRKLNLEMRHVGYAFFEYRTLHELGVVDDEFMGKTEREKDALISSYFEVRKFHFKIVSRVHRQILQHLKSDKLRRHFATYERDNHVEIHWPGQVPDHPPVNITGGTVVMFNDDCNPARKSHKEAYENPAYNESYKCFCEMARSKNMRLVISHFDDYRNGVATHAWELVEGEWMVVEDVKPDLIYDKFPASNSHTRSIKGRIVASKIPILNHPDIELLCKDKQLTADTFQEFSIPTGPLNRSDPIKSITNFRARLPDHPDLTRSSTIVKPRYGHGGKGMFEVKGDDFSKLTGLGGDEYVLQPFMESDAGLKSLNITTRHDFRVIMSNETPVLCYVRTAPENDFRAGIETGGSLTYIDPNSIPLPFRDMIAKIDHHMKQFGTRLYSIDMAKGNSGKAWLIEMNGKPGQVWKKDIAGDVENTKILMGFILDTLKSGLPKK